MIPVIKVFTVNIVINLVVFLILKLVFLDISSSKMKFSVVIITQDFVLIKS